MFDDADVGDAKDDCCDAKHDNEVDLFDVLVAAEKIHIDAVEGEQGLCAPETSVDCCVGSVCLHDDRGEDQEQKQGSQALACRHGGWDLHYLQISMAVATRCVLMYVLPR